MSVELRIRCEAKDEGDRARDAGFSKALGGPLMKQLLGPHEKEVLTGAFPKAADALAIDGIIAAGAFFRWGVEEQRKTWTLPSVPPAGHRDLTPGLGPKMEPGKVAQFALGRLCGPGGLGL